MNRNHRVPKRIAIPVAIYALTALATTTPMALAEAFDSGSDGSDGALVLTNPDPNPSPTPHVILFDPTDESIVGRTLDADGDGIYHFTTIEIGPNVIVKMTAEYLNGPVFWLASGAVVIDGTIDLSGEPGHNGQDILSARLASIPGAGGYPGGVGGTSGTSASPPEPGSGPGKGGVSTKGGGGAGYSATGANSANNDDICQHAGGGGGPSYGNPFVIPFVGGSGGAGGVVHETRNGGGGGAGAGALLVASASTVVIRGQVLANGGKGGNSLVFAGGGGSGGAIRLIAPTISGNGILRATGGSGGTGHDVNCHPNGWRARGHGGSGAKGRIRLEAFQHQFAGTSDPAPLGLHSPYGLFLPDTPAPALRVVSVGGQAIVNPKASFTPADVEIDTTELVPVVVEARNLPVQSGDPPVGTVARLHVSSENSQDATFEATLTGSAEMSTATIMARFPSGFSRAYARSTWSPQ